MNIKPIKKFGQNYLIDQNITNKIVDEITPLTDDKIIEIGPGLGALTSKLYNKSKSFTVVEIDRRVIEFLTEKFPGINIINKDILKVDFPSIYKSKELRIVGNLPYNITSSILFRLIENKAIIKDAVFMIQYEVAKRITAEPRTKDYGILSVLLNYFFNPKFCFKVSPNVFKPVPNVDSAVIHIFKNENLDPILNEKLFIKLVKASFGNRRKTLKNSLKNSIFIDYDFSKINVDLTRRAEELSVSEFIHLTKLIQPGINEK
ncbi:MAG: 16S rRNA (adenine(1518)-N(6)/adenine(1519)-N(6))-dimethyltransferase RsmA [Melioribacteraceae bacterium]|nr:16S rRNA (adenine(1518)-N(6)/adenine(1519)-N(6))-dimethyltransferase RsmA [Melioribacteraceae bacterium]MCF8356175.1 16S rRNA (adenine(1518)-N(6)/adenine(1519)-N(6))-dimethyltransferase RsmA [Melioribacteraceae bacterium]MCF8394746.1 16S rRNA (adenine(1518)-N(6)/adenine(1519)-N(6))-dimethyltransferase RsmA [Melioribacteraceae bacterium]MCF8417954.1 16S rRNA (adenine(1518)-N(6)/adenine(1519)-N(6))-dimethyltransferase RsmA [Melioribacteraceae bacterium]